MQILGDRTEENNNNNQKHTHTNKQRNKQTIKPREYYMWESFFP